MPGFDYPGRPGGRAVGMKKAGPGDGTGPRSVVRQLVVSEVSSTTKDVWRLESSEAVNRMVTVLPL